MLRKVSFLICIVILFSCKSPGIPEEVSLYYPEPGVWKKKDTAAMGFDAVKLEEAITFGLENQTQGPKNWELCSRPGRRQGPTGEELLLLLNSNPIICHCIILEQLI